MASRVRVAAWACVVASGLFIAGTGGAMALADPGDGYDRTDDRNPDDSIGDIVRRAFGLDDGNREKASHPWQRPSTRWGNGRPGQAPGEKEPPKSETSPTPPTTKTTEPTTPCPEPSQPPGPPAPNPPESGGGGGGGAIIPLPPFKLPSIPDMQLPGELQPSQPGAPGGSDVLDAGAGAAAAAAPLGPAAPIAMPVIVAPPVGIGAGGAGAGGASAGPPPAVPRAVTAEPPAGRISPPANGGSNVAVPNPSYRAGYTEYLRSAALPQVAALALPGLAGILVLTGAGGLVGYRQAKAGHAVRVSGSARFMR